MTNVYHMELIAYNIRSLYNVGAFFRNADAFGVSHLYLAGYTATPPRPEISKVALGAEGTVAWSKEHDVRALIDRLHKEGKRVVAFEANERFEPIDRFAFRENDVLLFGNEPDGIDEELLNIVDAHVVIPMRGKKSSLNVAVACGVGLYVSSYPTLPPLAGEGFNI